ncbi:MAG TPA: DUF4156 domain-containing protein [Gammaproteobacteria bacterium]
MSRLLIRIAALALLGFVTACSWVALEKGANDVLVLPPERLTADCESLGNVTVSVAAKVGVLERHDDEVIEDLNILARNYAAEKGGDTAVPHGAVTDGARKYEIFRCTDAAVENDADARESTDDDVEVIPYRGGD